MKTVFATLLIAAPLCAQSTATQSTPPKNPLVATSQAFFASAKNNILRSADKVPDDLWSYQPAPTVRTFAQMFAHIADGQYEFCGMASEGKVVDKGIEKAATTKAAILAALKDAFAYCDAAYAKMTDATAVEMVPFFNRQVTRIGAMDFNVVHTMEHYGNLVTYMRLKNIVPPTSRQ
ncbi:MAG TPA: DinB family protein [Candidatus Solibacter sp.]|nr:DinB family protein [Candidatus Solibacter sp.]